MNKTILGIEPEYDDLTSITFPIRSIELYSQLPAGFDVRILEREDAVRSEVSGQLDSGDVVLLTGVGHGDTFLFRGHSGDVIFNIGLGANNPVVEGAIVHLLSCQTANDLGPFLVSERGCSAFFGYGVEFFLRLADDDESSRRLSVDAAIDLALAAGNTAQEAYDKAMDRYSKFVEQLDEDGQLYLASQYDEIFSNLLLLGDLTAKL